MSKDNKDKSAFKTDKSVEDLMKSATEAVDDKVKPTKATEKSNHTIAIIAAGAILFLVVVVIGISLIPQAQEFIDKTKLPSWLVSEQGEQGGQDDKPLIAIDPLDFDYPVEVPEWAKTPYSELDILGDEELYKEIISWSQNYAGFQRGLGFMPSKYSYNDDGDLVLSDYTNDSNYEYDENGNYNSNYYPVLRNDYEATYALAINRLINPAFGGWAFAQYADGNSVKSMPSFGSLVDLFTADWWSTNIVVDDYSNLPILADWDGNIFKELGVKQSSDSKGIGYVYGEVSIDEGKEITTKELGVDSNGSLVLEVITPITYKAIGSDNRGVEIDGSIKLVLSPNSHIYDDLYKVIVSYAEIVLE